MKKIKGFTLVELLIVIAVIAILAAVAFVAIDPATRFKEARNSERWSNVSSILEAIQQYIVDNSGSLPSTISAPSSGYNYYVIGTGSGTPTCTALGSVTMTYTNLTSALVTRYFASIPYDPSTGSASNSQYYLTIDSSNHITIGACAPEAVRGTTPTISVTR
jgi:prepilin-type N-terminal cleavage/methylation domain-containing protein